MRFSALGCMKGAPGAGDEPAYINTPNFDSIAADGALFTHAFSTTPVCSPYRTGLQTGRYSHSTGFKLQRDETTLPQVLKRQGYATGYVGKWHMTPVSAQGAGGQVPAEFRSGWDFFAGLEVSHDYFDTNIYVNDEPEPRPIPGYESAAQTDLAIEFIERNRDRPFLLMLSWGPPHNPYEPPVEHDVDEPEQVPIRPNVPAERAEEARHTIARYYGQVTSLDEQMGRLLKSLDDAGAAENTIVCFTSDHGDMLHSQGQLLKRRPWDESARVPFVMRWPAQLRAGTTHEFPFGSVNLMPTLLGFVGAPIPDRVQGEDLSRQILGGGGEPPSEVLLEQTQPGNTPHYAQWRALRTRRWLYAESGHSETPQWLLYDAELDPFQLENLVDSEQHSRVLTELKAQLAEWRARTADTTDIRADFLRRPHPPRRDR